MKRGLLDERARGADQDLALKLRDNELRLLAESNERLKFNNEKLTKRIAALQQALEESTQSSPASSGAGQGWLSGFFPAPALEAAEATSDAFNVLRDELKRKNLENSKLHMELASVKEESQQSIDLLNLKISKLKESAESQSDGFRGELISTEARLSTSKEVESSLRQQVKTMGLQLEEMRREVAKKEKEVEYILQEASSEDSLSRQVVSRQVLVDDTSDLAFSTLNASSAEFGSDPSRQILIAQGTMAVQAVVASLAAVALAEQSRFAEAKAKSSGDPHIDLLSGKLFELYGEFPGLLDQLSRSLHRVKSAVGESDVAFWQNETAIFQDVLAKTIDCHQKITTASQLFCLEELKQKEGPSKSKAKSIHDGLGSAHAVFERISVSVGLLLEGSLSTSKRSRDQNLMVVIGHLRESFESMATTTLSLRNDYEEKFRSEETPSTSTKAKEAFAIVVLAYEALSRDTISAKQVLVDFANLLTAPPPLPSRGVALRPGEVKAAPFQKRALKFMSLINAQKPHFHLSYDQQIQNVQSLETMTRSLQEASIESATLRGSATTLQGELNSLKSSMKLLREELDSKNSLALKLSSDLIEAKRKLEEGTSLITQLRSVNAKFADQGQPLSPRGAPPARLPPALTLIEKAETKRPETLKMDVKPQAKPLVPSIPIPGATSSSTSAGSKPRSTSKSYNPFDSGEPTAPAKSDASNYNPFASLEEKKPGQTQPSYNPFEIAPVPNPTVSKEANDYNPFASPPPKSASTQTKLAPQPVAKEPEPVQKARSSDFTVSVVSQDGELHDGLQVPPQDLEREQRLKLHYENSIQQLTSQLRLSDSKALDLYNRQQKLEKLVKAAKAERDSLQKKLSVATEKSTSFENAERDLKEQYEIQIHTLTEHIVKVTEMSARYKEELEQSRAAPSRR